ncbi:putative transposase YbfD/YdcC associated with H repeats (plasmid) [Nostoc flagelliforme CCNUN1]|uniref:Putative transposase YbfD/YdcC associated with H repeats n=1 Tax=Nostoc flagelliforme CCNUN1 TaxID=2038116 RepID=A0A2K8T8U2_9NOSO|nr:putative transposase YbfD/YdcC associated with H repeats [Nostoc flagelliforme CCNUN1]
MSGIPSHDTIARVFALDPQAFEQCFQRWVESKQFKIHALLIQNYNQCLL